MSAVEGGLAASWDAGALVSRLRAAGVDEDRPVGECRLRGCGFEPLEGGSGGGRIVAAGTPQELARRPAKSHTGKALAQFFASRAAA
mgnify:CR=1 FL=1